VGIPTVLVHEGEGLIVTVETKSGHVYRGKVDSTEDSMNMVMSNVLVTNPDGTQTGMNKLFIRGSQVVFLILPDMLTRAPMFERVRKASKGIAFAGGLGRGRQAAISSVKGAFSRAGE